MGHVRLSHPAVGSSGCFGGCSSLHGVGLFLQQLRLQLLDDGLNINHDNNNETISHAVLPVNDSTV